MTHCLRQGSPNYGPRSHFANDEKITYSTYEKFINLIEYNISRNNHFARASGPRHVLYCLTVALAQKSLETPDLQHDSLKNDIDVDRQVKSLHC